MIPLCQKPLSITTVQKITNDAKIAAAIEKVRSIHKVKIIQWDRNGFEIYYKKLQKGRFKYPEMTQSFLELSELELNQLLDGIDFTRLKPLPTLHCDYVRQNFTPCITDYYTDVNYAICMLNTATLSVSETIPTRDPDQLLAIIDELHKRNELLRKMVYYLTLKRFGASSEKIIDSQANLFDNTQSNAGY